MRTTQNERSALAARIDLGAASVKTLGPDKQGEEEPSQYRQPALIDR